ncbi:50S ribosomal protein L25 [Trichococcus ilyis]|jgi:large subunit ribosomal protein L25|uniref:Large ribosomal subunit protein bL25 n=1 Tax=Trichococcus ilyis TaxID=640938 RepID=A0A143YFI1_9LACT|nr:50S ribosomal protein L25 [Trichococcus ilyis]CZQ87681.1 ribosomal protein l25 [Trichococcus ilyis]SEI65840.1 large subunit ribosomal protein L25 [Trichococcus ilyis]
MKLQVEKRDRVGSSASKHARLDKKLTAVIYGKDVEATPVLLDAKDFDEVLKQLGKNAVFEAAMTGGKTMQVIVKNIQQSALKNQIQNIELQAITKGQKLTMSVPIHLVGSEAVKEGVLTQTLNELEIETDAAHVPTEFQIAVSGLTIGDSVAVADIQVDSGITVLTDPEEAVAVVAAPIFEETETAEEEPVSESEAVME